MPVACTQVANQPYTKQAIIRFVFHALIGLKGFGRHR